MAGGRVPQVTAAIPMSPKERVDKLRAGYGTLLPATVPDATASLLF